MISFAILIRIISSNENEIDTTTEVRLLPDQVESALTVTRGEGTPKSLSFGPIYFFGVFPSLFFVIVSTF
jgi:hypothetical protein